MTQSRPDTGDDRIIAVVFRRSLWLLLSLGLLAGCLWLWMARPPSVRPPAEPMVAVPSQPAEVSVPRFDFVEVAAQSGLDFEFVNGAEGERLLPETMVGGVTIFDFDNDADQDVLLIGGNHWPWSKAAPLDQALGLFANDGFGNFTRVDRDLGLVAPDYGMGAAVGDYDGDGFLDVYLTTVGHNRLFRNVGGKSFEDVTREMGVAGGEQDWSTAATFFDADGDGWLDLFVGNYVAWDRAIDQEVNYQLAGVGRAYGPPTDFGGAQPLLFRNLSGGGFADVTKFSNLEINGSTGPVAKSLAVLPIDLDRDGDTDLVVANDTTRNVVYLNNGDGIFIESGESLGLAFDNMGHATGAMGIDSTTLSGGTVVVAIGNFANEMTSVFMANAGNSPGSLVFADDAVITGVGPASRAALTFGLFFADLNLDGYSELFHANGHVEVNINQVQRSQTYQQPAQVFWNCGPGCDRPFEPASEIGDLSTPAVGRAAAYADLDGDGDLDIVMGQAGGTVKMFRNQTESPHHWLRLELRDRPPNIFAFGAVVEVEAGENVQIRQVTPTRSYLSQTEFITTFGLGRWTAVERISIRWPDGYRQELAGVAADQSLIIWRDDGQ